MPKLPASLTAAIEKLLALRPVNRRVRTVNQFLPYDEDASLLNMAAELLSRSSRPEYPYSVSVKHGTPTRYKGLPRPATDYSPTLPKAIYTTPAGKAAATYATDHHDGIPQENPRVFDLMMMSKDIDYTHGWAKGSKHPGVAEFFVHGGRRNGENPYDVYVTNSPDMLVPRVSKEGQLRETMKEVMSGIPYSKGGELTDIPQSPESAVLSLLELSPRKTPRETSIFPSYQEEIPEQYLWETDPHEAATENLPPGVKNMLMKRVGDRNLMTKRRMYEKGDQMDLFGGPLKGHKLSTLVDALRYMSVIYDVPF